jgi:hypothetical protein
MGGSRAGIDRADSGLKLGRYEFTEGGVVATKIYTTERDIKGIRD